MILMKKTVIKPEEIPRISKKWPKDWQACSQQQSEKDCVSNKKGREMHHLALPFPQKGQTPLLWKYPAVHTPAQGKGPEKQVCLGKKLSKVKAFFLLYLLWFRAKFWS